VTKIRTSADLEALQQAILSKRDPNKQVLRVCCTTACRAGGALEVVENLEKELAGAGLQDMVEIKKTGCRGFCENGPVMVIEPQNIFYNLVKPEDVTKIVNSTLVEGRPVKRLLYTDAETRKKIASEKEIPFFRKQIRNVFGKTGKIDPAQIDDYIAEGGYAALCKALTTMKPEEIIETIEASGLRGRGTANPKSEIWSPVFPPFLRR